MHRTVIGWVIYGGRHCRRAKIFYLPQPGIEPRSLDLQANTLPRRCKSQLLPQGSRSELYIYLDPVTCIKVRKRAKIRNRYDQAPHLTQDTNGKVTTSQLDITNESEYVSPFPADYHMACRKYTKSLSVDWCMSQIKRSNNESLLHKEAIRQSVTQKPLK